jgi:opacity protein-like surface antigen
MNNSKKLLTALSIGTLIVSISAHSKPYISAQVGAASGNEIQISTFADNDNKIGVTGRLATGYLWDLSDNFKLGVEAGAQVYQNTEDKTQGYNSIDGKNVTVSVMAKRWGLDILGVADYFITERFDIFAKLGTAFVHQEFPARVNGNSHYNGDEFYIFLDGQALKPQSRFVPKAVVGAGYNVQKNLNLNLSINHEFKNDNHVVPGVRSFLVGAKYSFS